MRRTFTQYVFRQNALIRSKDVCENYLITNILVIMRPRVVLYMNWHSKETINMFWHCDGI